MEWFKNLNIKYKIIIITFVALIICVASFFAIREFGSKKGGNKPVVKYNKGAEILKEREIKGLTIHDISLRIEDGQSNYRAKATNKTDHNIEFVGIGITFYNDATEMGRIEMYQEKTIEPGETIDLENFTDMNLLKATDLKLDWIGE